MTTPASEAVRLYQTILDVGYVMPPNEATKAIQAALDAARREGREEAAKIVRSWQLCLPKEDDGPMRLLPFITTYGTDNLLAAIRASQPGAGGGKS